MKLPISSQKLREAEFRDPMIATVINLKHPLVTSRHIVTW